MLNHSIDNVVVGAVGIIVNFNLINLVTTFPYCCYRNEN